jgi:hypothetical protein
MTIRDVGPLELAIFVAIGTFFVHGCLEYFLEFTPTFGLILALSEPPVPPTTAAQMRRGSAADG